MARDPSKLGSEKVLEGTLLGVGLEGWRGPHWSPPGRELPENAHRSQEEFDDIPSIEFPTKLHLEVLFCCF